MKKIELYLDDDFKDIFQDWDEVKVYKTLSVADDIDLWGRAINLEGKFYSVCCSQGNKYKIRGLEQFNPEEDENCGEDEIKCPICGYEISDSWEYSDDSGELECCGCGATLEWNREVEVTYSAGVKQPLQAIKL